nr:hydantoinase B/oxoprolinase family protein [uncultured Desulfuromonas sp.]
MTLAWAGIHFAIDRGGTFTDVYAQLPDGRSFVHKLLSEDPQNYPDAPREGIRRILEQVSGERVPQTFSGDGIASVRMGTTVATNALLEHKGAKTALLISAGFADLLQIGDQTRPELFALKIERPVPLYDQVVEVDERIRPVQPHEQADMTGSDGRGYRRLQAPPLELVRTQLEHLLQQGIVSVAVVFAHGYACPEHEQQVGAVARKLGFAQVSLSHEVMPTARLVARGDTTVVDAYLTPKIRQYGEGFRHGFSDGLSGTGLRFMTSDGGLVPSESFNGSRALLSGPAGGVVGFAQTCRSALPGRAVIGFDMGGTSTDVSRFDGEYDLVQYSEIAGTRIQAPQLNIQTVAAGGGSRLFFRHGMFEVGPESAGAHPGPVCYRKGGHLTVTDANLLLGRLQPEYFPKIFGDDEHQPLDLTETRRAFAELTDEVNLWLQQQDRPPMTVEQVAAGFIDVANEQMARPVRAVSVQKGFDLGEHVLACFGGAGGQHACAMARKLGMETIFIHRHAGILSAYGMELAQPVCELQQAASGELTPLLQSQLEGVQQQLTEDAGRTLRAQGLEPEQIDCCGYLNMRYAGTDHAMMIAQPEDGDYIRAFREAYRREYGFELQAVIEVDDVRVRAVGCQPVALPDGAATGAAPEPVARVNCYFDGEDYDTPVYLWQEGCAGVDLNGPALLIRETATVVVEPGCQACFNRDGDLLITVSARRHDYTTALDPVQLALFSNRFMSIAEQMGYALQRTAISTNIKERCDFSCALFDADGALIANAPHTPVHLGAMGEAVRAQIAVVDEPLSPGDVLLSNHPSMGGSHLPDMTVITPLWHDGTIVMYVANRGHHADIGGVTPGSMPPFSRMLAEEGCAIRRVKLVKNGVFQETELTELLVNAGSRRLNDNLSDFRAQIAANQCGCRLLLELIGQVGLPCVRAYMGYIQDHAEAAVRAGLLQLVKRRGGLRQLSAEDFLDDGTALRLTVEVDPHGDAHFDFGQSDEQQWGNLNAPTAVAWSAILYALRCLVDEPIPLNHGCLRPVHLSVAAGSILAPDEQAAVVGGNVLTSQRIVDVLFKAFGCVAASQGCMNNFTFGNDAFGYYETIGGGSGAGSGWDGCSGVHTHMTNTRITDPEILELRYPVLLRRFGLRYGSGGCGKWRGGDGLVREIEFLQSLTASILSERRVFAPYGLDGGESGRCGRNRLWRCGRGWVNLGGKNTLPVFAGDRLRIETPGGGGYGKCDDRCSGSVMIHSCKKGLKRVTGIL